MVHQHLQQKHESNKNLRNYLNEEQEHHDQRHQYCCRDKKLA